MSRILFSGDIYQKPQWKWLIIGVFEIIIYMLFDKRFEMFITNGLVDLV